MARGTPLNDEQKAQIMKEKDQKFPSQLARELDVTPDTVRNFIAKNKK